MTDIYINSDTKVRLVGDQSATSGTLVEMVQDGTYNYWTTDENLVTGNTIENGIWKIETINAVEYLTVNVPNEGIIAFKVDSGNLMITKVGGVGSTDSETFYYGVDFNTFGSIVANVYLNTPKFISSGGFPINISTIEEIPNATVVYDADAFVYDTADVGIAYSISGTDSSLFSISSTTGEVKFKESPDFETKKDNGENNIYDFTVTATADGKSADQAVSITVTDLSYESLAGGGNGTTAIDLGAGYGQLINGVRVEGKWYYYWDRSGDGTSAGADYTTHNILDGIFNNDINGVTNTTVANADGLYGTTDTYRYATINEVRVALPTANGGVAYPRGINHYQNGTAYSDPTEGGASDTTTSTPFNELLAIWDAFNGTGTSGYCDGTPSSGWDASTYWSATTSDSGHAYVNLYDGIVYRYGDTNDLRVALQVL